MIKPIKANSSYLRFILIISLLIPGVVALLLFAPVNFKTASDSWIRSLPAFNAIINSFTASLMLLALIAIKKKRINLHRNLMTTCLILGVVFLVSYVTYHASADSVIFGDLDHDGVLSEDEKSQAGAYRSIYLFVLLSHIALSIVVVPFVLLAFYFALSNQISRHRRIVKYTFPVWLYVSITGVVVYLMISPYYL